MSPLPKENFVVACDIGTTQITMIGAHISDGINILGSTIIPNQSVKSGHILNLEMLVESLYEGCDELERQTGLPIVSARVTMPSSDFRSELFCQDLHLKNGEVTEVELEKILQQSRVVTPNQAHDWIHLISHTFELDGKKNVSDPRGLFGQKLTNITHGISAPLSDIRTLHRAFNRSGLKAESLAFQGLAAAHASITSDEAELGCLVIHFGASTTSFIRFDMGHSVLAAQIPVGSQHITRDLSIGLRTSISEAERLKKAYGSRHSDSDLGVMNDFEFSLLGMADGHSQNTRTVNKKDFRLIVESRLTETLELIEAKLFTDKELNKNLIGKGIVLSGGGSQLPGLVPFVEKHFELPTRMGQISACRGISDAQFDSSSLTALGLLDPKFRGVSHEPLCARASLGKKGFLNRMRVSFREKFLEQP